jgi:hypothetical protein
MSTVLDNMISMYAVLVSQILCYKVWVIITRPAEPPYRKLLIPLYVAEDYWTLWADQGITQA